MVPFLSSFSDSFVVALIAWPFVAFILTLPLLIIQYRRFNKIIFSRAITAYFAMLYFLGLVSFTLYPLPDNPLEFCKNYDLSPQLLPLQFIHDIQSDGMRAVLQVIMNVVFFLPLGVFARLFFRWKLRTTILVSMIASLTIETAQLTGGFGVYPCSYRLFDVDDLLFNTLGGFIGYAFAVLIPQSELQKAQNGDITHQAGLLRHSIAYIIDMSLAFVITLFIILPTYYFFDENIALALRDPLYYGVVALVFGIIPLLRNGFSPGGAVVRLSHDDIQRRPGIRLAYYCLRVGLVLLLVTSQGIVFVIAILVILVSWFRYKKLPHQFVGK